MKSYFILTALLLLSANPCSGKSRYYESLIEKLEEDKAALKELEDEIVNNRNLHKNNDGTKRFSPLDEFALNEKNEDKIRESLGGDYTLFQGDMIISKKKEEALFENSGESGKLKDDVFRDGLRSLNTRWEMPIHYKFRSDLPQSSKEAFIAGAKEIEKVTSCIRFKKWESGVRDYLEIINGDGCWSYIGKEGGKQQLSLQSEGCDSKGTAMHEIIHALGFFHEQSRPDRDNYVRINLNNIDEGNRHNFDKQKPSVVDTYGVEYDIKSIMHYKNHDFSTNGKPTIVSKENPNEELGSEELQDTDVKQLNNMYCGGSPGTEKPVTEKPNTDKPATEEPNTEKPTTGEPTTAEPTTVEATTAEPKTDQTTTAEPATGETTTAEPTTDEVTTAEPGTGETTTTEPATGETTTAEPTTGEVTTAEPTADDEDTRAKDNDFDDIDDKEDGEGEKEEENKIKKGDEIIAAVEAIQNDLESLKQKLII